MNIAIIYLTMSSIGYFGYIYEGKISYFFYFIHTLITPLFSILLLEIPNVANMPYIMIMVGIIITIIIYTLHIKSSKNYTIEYALVQILPVILVSFLFLLAVTLPNSYIMTLTIRRFLFVLFLSVFILFSIPNLNKKYRMLQICKRLKYNSKEDLKIEYSEKISKCTNIIQEDRDLLFYYFSNGIDLYIEGNYENAFLSFYKIIFDRKFDDYYIIDEYDDKRKNYALIRHVLSHAKIEEYRIEDVEYNIDSVEKVNEIKRELLKTTLDLLELSLTEFLNEVINEYYTD